MMSWTIPRFAALDAEFDESKVKRDHGRFASSAGAKAALPEMLHHVTEAKNVAKIKKEGLRRFQTSQWVKQGSGKRYGGGEVYAFEHELDALRWAARMDWDLHSKTGSGKIAVVRLRPGEHPWEEDENDPLSQMGRKGRWLKSQHPIHPRHIVDAKNIDFAALEPLREANRA